MRVLFVSSEAYPLAKTGGLADVSEALPHALTRLGADVRVLMPGYRCAMEQVFRPWTVADLSGIMGVGDARLLATRIPGAELPVWLIDAPELYDRDGLYQDKNGQDWPDNARRFAFLAHVAARIATGRTDVAWVPDVVHANDWHTGLIPLLLAHEAEPSPPTVFTLHNMAFQGVFPAETLGQLDLPEGDSCPNGMEYYGQISFLKAGIHYANKLTTVSPTYAREILTPEFGFGFEGLMRARCDDLNGILNGADYDIWDPAQDPFLSNNYDAAHLNGKRACKAVLQRELGLPEARDVPLMAYISRLTEQKMADALYDALPRLIAEDAQIVLLSDGDHGLEQKFCDAARTQPSKIAVRIGYEEPLAHRMQAGADILLAPARFEPCGLSQIYAMRYGTVPIVRATGGLADTVVDTSRTSISDGTATGFVFSEPTTEALEQTILRACTFYREPLAWRRLQLGAMKQDFSWTRSAQQYFALYETLTSVDSVRLTPFALPYEPSAADSELEQIA